MYYTFVIGLPCDLSCTNSLSSAQRTEFYERHKFIAVVGFVAIGIWVLLDTRAI